MLTSERQIDSGLTRQQFDERSDDGRSSQSCLGVGLKHAHAQSGEEGVRMADRVDFQALQLSIWLRSGASSIGL